MSKVAVVYWSMTGNTEAMANAVAEGAKLACDFVICHLTPDEDGKEACRKLGAALA